MNPFETSCQTILQLPDPWEPRLFSLPEGITIEGYLPHFELHLKEIEKLINVNQ
jgi:hypothetical protein